MQKIVTALTDLTFKKFVTPQIVTYIYIIGIIFSAVSSFSMLKMMGWFGIIMAPVTLVTSIIFLRCGLELVLAVFQIARYSAEIARRGRPPGLMEDVEKDLPLSE